MALSSPRRWFSKPCHGTTAGPGVATGRGGRNDRRYHPCFTEEAARGRRLPSYQRALCAGDAHGDWLWEGRVRQLLRQAGKKELGLPASNRPPAFFAVSPLKRLLDV